MKKLLMILICLFVSFEVKSNEIVINCKQIKSTYKDFFEDYPIEKNQSVTDLKYNLYLDIKNKWLSFYSRDNYDKNSTLDFFEKTDKIIFIRTTDDNREIFTLNRSDGTLSVRSSWFNNITEDSVFYKMYKHRKFKYVTTDFYEYEKSDRIF